MLLNILFSWFDDLWPLWCDTTQLPSLEILEGESQSRKEKEDCINQCEARWCY